MRINSTAFLNVINKLSAELYKNMKYGDSTTNIAMSRILGDLIGSIEATDEITSLQVSEIDHSGLALLKDLIVENEPLAMATYHEGGTINDAPTDVAAVINKIVQEGTHVSSTEADSAVTATGRAQSETA